MDGGVGKSVSEKTSAAVSLKALGPSDWGPWREWVRTRNPPPFHTPEWLTLQARAFRGEVVYYPRNPASSRVDITVLTDSLEVLTPPDTAEIRQVMQRRRYSSCLHRQRIDDRVEGALLHVPAA